MYHPLTKLKSIQADVLNKIGVDVAMKFISEYHKHHETGCVIHETELGNIKVFSDENAIYVKWDDSDT